MQANKIKNRIISWARFKLNLPPVFVEAKIFEKEFHVREGTIRSVPDFDDAWLIACASKAEIIFDIGANIGQSAFLELTPDGVDNLLLVEPNPLALSVAAENLIHNHLIHRVNMKCAFVSDGSNAKIDFFTVGSGAAGSMYPNHAKTASKKNSHYFVPSITIDELCEQYGIPDLIKIDIEGAESYALAGAKACLLKQQTRFLIEMHSNTDLPMEENARKVLQICQENNYKAWYLSRQKELTNPEDVSDRGRCHLLLQPCSWPWPWPELVTQIQQSAPIDRKLQELIFHQTAS